MIFDIGFSVACVAAMIWLTIRYPPHEAEARSSAWWARHPHAQQVMERIAHTVGQLYWLVAVSIGAVLVVWLLPVLLLGLLVGLALGALGMLACIVRAVAQRQQDASTRPATGARLDPALPGAG
jgi:Flp pilus assembly protein TadB